MATSFEVEVDHSCHGNEHQYDADTVQWCLQRTELGRKDEQPGERNTEYDDRTRKAFRP
ncbi:hypothetical protein GII36_04545 [Candidatus Mycosynbacter amalyticus]|uniref:Uncharacterized protein n=1 Tax=Candidatus Mycosynbacter amalyticus TaxID=2665156 RepID=A0A857MUM6_9BACT|nr:hypothetical protein [Candidatus Mycosynbacter amalyticus]QHN43097.1 hypothetical protein GII36_04545 [Candidatus Mycosynbacter amalyticus]